MNISFEVGYWKAQKNGTGRQAYQDPSKKGLSNHWWMTFHQSSPLRCFDRFSVSNLSFDLNLHQLFGKFAEPSLTSQDTNASCSRKSYLQYKPRTSWGGKKRCSPRDRFDGIFQQNQVYLKTHNQTKISPTNPRKKKKKVNILSKEGTFFRPKWNHISPT